MDASYQSGWSKSSLRFMGFVEEIVFGEDYDGYLKTGCRAGKSAADILEYPTLKSHVQSIEGMIKSENEEAKKKNNLVADGQTQPAGGVTTTTTSGGDGDGAATSSAAGDDRQPQQSLGKSEADREISRLVHACIKIVVEPDTQTELIRLLQSSSVGKMLGQAHKQYILITFDVKFSGECDTKPHMRICPWVANRAKKLVHATIEARATAAGYETTQLVPGDFFLIPDGGKHGNLHRIKGLFKDDNGERFKHHSACVKVIKSEKGISDRHAGSRRGIGSISQDEYFYTIALDKMKLPVTQRKNFSGTNKGNSITDVPVLAKNSCWTLPKTKKTSVIDKYIIRAGGKDDDDDSSSSDEPAIEDASVPINVCACTTDTLSWCFFGASRGSPPA